MMKKSSKLDKVPATKESTLQDIEDCKKDIQFLTAAIEALDGFTKVRDHSARFHWQADITEIREVLHWANLNLQVATKYAEAHNWL